jgi:hypothetical protein
MATAGIQVTAEIQATPRMQATKGTQATAWTPKMQRHKNPRYSNNIGQQQ